jgi:predicted esterase
MDDDERWGWTWWHWSDTTDPAFISREVTLDQSVRWVVQAIEEVKRDYAVDPEKVFLFGFSQGGFLTFKVGLEHPQLFRGILPAGGWMEFDTLTAFALDSAALDLPVRILHGEYDPVCEFAGAVAAFDTLSAYGVPVELMRYPAEHTLPRELWEDARDFVYCQLYEGDVPPLTALLWPDEEPTPELHAEALKQVLCSAEPVPDIEAGLLLLAEDDPDTLIELQIVYLLGARRCLGAEEYLIYTMQDVTKPQLLRQASLNALNKLGTETAWQAAAGVKKQVVITEVVPGTQADSLGLAAGDVLLSYDGKFARTYLDFRQALAEVKPKKNKVKMVIMRDGEKKTIALVPGFIGIRLAEEIK